MGNLLIRMERRVCCVSCCLITHILIHKRMYMKFSTKTLNFANAHNNKTDSRLQFFEIVSVNLILLFRFLGMTRKNPQLSTRFSEIMYTPIRLDHVNQGPIKIMDSYATLQVLGNEMWFFF